MRAARAFGTRPNRLVGYQWLFADGCLSHERIRLGVAVTACSHARPGTLVMKTVAAHGPHGPLPTPKFLVSQAFLGAHVHQPLGTPARLFPPAVKRPTLLELRFGCRPGLYGKVTDALLIGSHPGSAGRGTRGPRAAASNEGTKAAFAVRRTLSAARVFGSCDG